MIIGNVTIDTLINWMEKIRRPKRKRIGHISHAIGIREMTFKRKQRIK